MRPATPEPQARRRGALRVPGLCALAAVAAVGLVAVVDPNQPGHYPTCPFLFLTGMYCPGCGSLRALHDLTQLALAGAWGMNPLLVLAVPVVVAAWVGWTVRTARGRPRTLVVPARAINGLAVLVLLYWVARNIPVL